MQWVDLKFSLVAATGLHMDALHIYGGLLVQALAARLLRQPLCAWAPWAAVLAVELANEWIDLAHESWPDRAEQIAGSGYDVLNTLLLPSLILAAGRIMAAGRSAR